MFTIGEFSKVTGLTVKTLRFYHEQGILTPTCVDEQSGYRYYDERKIETARVISQLRGFDFSLDEISEILATFADDADILQILQQKRDAMDAKVQQYRDVRNSLDRIIHDEREARLTMQNSEFQIEEKTLAPVLVAGVRMKGKYSECGKGFSQIGRKFGRHICGKPMLLCYDMEYRPDDADFETCMPVRKAIDVEGISVHELPGGRCVTLLHQGPYEDLSRSYEKILTYVKEQGYEIECPCREAYIKGPGMIFRGNPKKYLTEIQMLIKSVDGEST